MRVPRDLQELALRVDRKVSELSTDLRRAADGRPRSRRRVGIEEEDVLEALEASGAYRATSLSTPRGNDDEAGETLGDTVGTSEEGFGLAESRATLEQLMRAVTPREREVLRLRFEEDLTQAEIGERIGVSQMQVSRIIRQSIARLRTVARTGGEDAAPAAAVAGEPPPRPRPPRAQLRHEPVAQQREPHRRRDRAQQAAAVGVERLRGLGREHEHPERLGGHHDRHGARPQVLGDPERGARRLVEPDRIAVAQRPRERRMRRDGHPAPARASRAASARS